MFKINKLVFYNYIPYYDEKVFDFGDQDGTTIIFGDNNIGKTSFIKGIRFLFFNDLSNNPDDPNFNILANINTKAFNEQKFEFFVSMNFSYDGTKYTFIRRYAKKPEVFGQPKSDKDFQDYEVIKTDEKSFGPLERKRIIDKVIPKNISEFIFFDGENIKKYVEILNNDGTTGAENRRVKNAINNIIGTPYLDSLITNLEHIESHAISDQNKMIKQNTNDIKLKNEIDRLTTLKSTMEESIKNTKAELTQEEARFESIKRDFSNISRSVDIFKDLSAQENVIDIEGKRITQSNLDLISEIQSSFKTLLFDKISSRKSRLSKETEKLSKKASEFNKINDRITELQKLIRDNVCTLCGTHLSNNNLASIQFETTNLLEDSKAVKLTDNENEKLSINKKMIKISDELLLGLPSFSKERIIKILQEIVSSELKIKQAKTRVSELKRELGGSSEELLDISKKIEQREIQKYVVEKLRKTVENLRVEIKSYDDQIVQKTKRISNVPGIEKIKNKLDLLRILISKFKNVKETFVEAMRKKVELSANELFLRCVHGINDDIDCIKINENYKMTIYVKNGSQIYQPSSGYNNLLALSLIYGLNRNSNLFGTIFFDAALSNLSNNYTNNIIKTLNDYAPQLIFLVHRDRIDIDSTRDILGTVRNEFELYQEGDSMNTLVRRY